MSVLKQKFQAFRGWFRGWKKWLIEFFIIVLIIVAVRAWQQQDIISGRAIPVHGQLIDGSHINWSQYQGKPMLLHFWATWCPVCRFEEDSIQSIAKDYPLLTIASWSDDTYDYMQKQQLSFPALEDVNGEWAKHYGVKAVPTTFIINSQGDIKFVETGFSSEWGLRLRLWWLGI